MSSWISKGPVLTELLLLWSLKGAIIISRGVPKLDSHSTKYTLLLSNTLVSIWQHPDKQWARVLFQSHNCKQNHMVKVFHHKNVCSVFTIFLFVLFILHRNRLLLIR